MTKPEKTIKRLLGVITLDQTYIEFVFPILTLLFFDSESRLLGPDASFATRSMWYGFCVSTPYFINLFFAPLLSTLSDEFGRRSFLLFEISSAFCYLLLAGFAVFYGQIWMLIAAFVLRGAFSRTNTTALAMIGDSCQKRKKLVYMGHLQVAIATGACLGPILSGFFAKSFNFSFFNFSLPFFIAAALACINIIMTYFYIDETLKNRVSQANSTAGSRLRANLQSVKYVITHPDILKISLLLLFFQITWSSYYQFIGPLLKSFYHFTPKELSFFIGMMAFWLVIGAGPIFRVLHHRINQQQMLAVSVLFELAGLGLTLAVYYDYLPSFFYWIGAFPIAVGDVLAYICLTTLYSNTVPEHMQGKVMGINFLIVGLIWGGSAMVGGLLAGYSPILPILLAPSGILASLFIIYSNYGRKLSLSYAD
jgi:MFS family permease